MNIDAVRAIFPALAGDTALLDNAGGTQVPRFVADHVRDYMLGSFVQVGADRVRATLNAPPSRPRSQPSSTSNSRCKKRCSATCDRYRRW